MTAEEARETARVAVEKSATEHVMTAAANGDLRVIILSYRSRVKNNWAIEYLKERGFKVEQRKRELCISWE